MYSEVNTSHPCCSSSLSLLLIDECLVEIAVHRKLCIISTCPHPCSPHVATRMRSPEVSHSAWRCQRDVGCRLLASCNVFHATRAQQPGLQPLQHLHPVLGRVVLRNLADETISSSMGARRGGTENRREGGMREARLMSGGHTEGHFLVQAVPSSQF